MKPLDPTYKRDLTRANERRYPCAQPGCQRIAVLLITIDGVTTDICERCWKQLKQGARS